MNTEQARKAGYEINDGAPFRYHVGQRVTCNGGYPGTITALYWPGGPVEMYEVLLGSGAVCIGPSDMEPVA
jgi:hypothetical protein